MRPLRFLLLLALFVALPLFLTCWSLLSSNDAPEDGLRAGYTTQTGRLKALFSFSTPSTLFPPSALISLTNDNSTFFLARPAAFGPSLPSKGLSGQLWVGRGFGDDAALQEGGVHTTGWELGCSDVPGWREDERKRLEKLVAAEKPQKRSIEASSSNQLAAEGSQDSSNDLPQDDGTDDYLHYPLVDSNPAPPGKPGEPANAELDKSKRPTHADIESLQESADIAGKIVLLARGGCGFLEKVKWVQRRGGVALIVGDREKGASLTIMYAKGDTSNVTIPAIFTSYNAAHLLASLVPARAPNDKTGSEMKSPPLNKKPVFTSTTSVATKAAAIAAARTDSPDDDDSGWMHDALAAIGLGDGPAWHQEDSRRPPGSGNLEWVLVENWDDEDNAKTNTKTQTKTSTKLATSTSSSFSRAATTGADDFVIGVQDWRDTELIAQQPSTSTSTSSSSKTQDTATSYSPLNTALKGGSITPGSGEYDHDKVDLAAKAKDKSSNDRQRQKMQGMQGTNAGSNGGWFPFFKSRPRISTQPPRAASGKDKTQKAPPSKSNNDGKEQEGLWVTLTPTSVSTSPFFDTLLVLVISPLVTLTIVYGLLLLRSRIRRRRWRAPKSVVERLPVRTYHTMSTSSSTTSSQISTPEHSSAASPLLHPAVQDISHRARPRSQTTNSVLSGPGVAGSQPSLRSLSRSPPSEKPKIKSNKRKKYTGRQIECVVCLEEYVDGESRVMSLPCGHEFHADCITPWLVNRRRTCPICKGDVVRSMARPSHAQGADGREEGEQTSDDVQTRAAQTVNEAPSAAIPIPVGLEESDEDEDIERGDGTNLPLLGGSQQTERQSAWRNVIARSLSRLSGDTVWGQNPLDRSR